MSNARRPIAPSHRARRRSGGSHSSATASTTAIAASVWIRLPTTCPASTETRAMAIVRKRAMIPSVMSMATAIAAPWAAPADGEQEDPGRRRS